MDDRQMRECNQAVWDRFKDHWREIARRHAAGEWWALFAEQDPNGVCQCPTCQLVRQVDTKEGERCGDGSVGCGESSSPPELPST